MKVRKVKHGWSRTPTYYTWVIIRARCNNPFNDNYVFFGGKGVRICKRWDVFLNFLEDMGPKPEGAWLIRINKKGNYSPENCEWLIK